jgi:hypothetical protein
VASAKYPRGRQPDWHIELAGDFSTINASMKKNVHSQLLGITTALFAIINSASQVAEAESLLDPTFVPPQVPGRVSAIAAQSDGKILIASYQFTNGVQSGFLSRFHTDGKTGCTWNLPLADRVWYKAKGE